MGPYPKQIKAIYPILGENNHAIESRVSLNKLVAIQLQTFPLQVLDFCSFGAFPTRNSTFDHVPIKSDLKSVLSGFS